jgi:tRNA(fMet)-specific endonuclease VapC
MALLIDSSVLIELERRSQSPNLLGQFAPDESLVIASITVSELLVGAYRADTPERRLRRVAFLESALAYLTVLSFDTRAARTHARILTDLTSIGRVIGANDLLIAATALANDYAVLTENVREFERVPGLVVRRPDW